MKLFILIVLKSEQNVCEYSGFQLEIVCHNKLTRRIDKLILYFYFNIF